MIIAVCIFFDVIGLANAQHQRLKPHKMTLIKAQNLKRATKLHKSIGGFNPLETIVSPLTLL